VWRMTSTCNTLRHTFWVYSAALSPIPCPASCWHSQDSLEDSRLLAQQRRWGVGGLELHAARGAVAGGGGAAHDNLPAPPTPARNSFVGVQARTSMQPSPRFSSQLPPWLVRLSSTRIPRLTSFVSSSTGTTPAVTQQQAHADSAVKSTRDPEEAGTCTGPGMGQATLSLLPGAMPNISDGADSMPPTQCSIKEHSSVHASPLPITANQEPGPSSVAAAGEPSCSISGYSQSLIVDEISHFLLPADARNTACHVGASITAGGAGVASHIVIPILGDGTRSAVSAPTP
jgi:hypothetical protein